MNEAAMSLDGKRVVVIGGTSGIGFAVAGLAQQLGAEVAIASSRAANVDAALERLRGATGDTIDLRDEDSVARFFTRLGAFDHLALTAGDWDIPMFVGARNLDLAAARDGFTVRFWGALAAVKHGSRSIDPNGSITLTSGMLAHRPAKGAPLPAALGGAIEHLARGLAVDLAPVRVNAVCPGIILTEHTSQMPQERLQAYLARLPLPRGAEPAEAATAYVYAMLNGYVTGQVLPVDGGGALV
ncbi:MAG TPA: SDR family oxidoreductase [Paraburkholderia sp.]|nr:SDR family oxidoreductase [Paraburkholderia sp.]